MFIYFTVKLEHQMYSYGPVGMLAYQYLCVAEILLEYVFKQPYRQKRKD